MLKMLNEKPILVSLTYLQWTLPERSRIKVHLQNKWLSLKLTIKKQAKEPVYKFKRFIKPLQILVKISISWKEVKEAQSV